LARVHDDELGERGLGRLAAIEHQPHRRHRLTDVVRDVPTRGSRRGQNDQSDGSGDEPRVPTPSARAERQNECLRRNSTA
jgi:hypothetical protein